MDSVLGIVFSAENVRLLVMLAVGFCGYVLMKGQMKDMERSIDKRMDGLEKRMDGLESGLEKRMEGLEAGLEKRMEGFESSLEKKMDAKLAAFHELLKSNDFAHLNSTIEALTFTLEKNGFLKREDKEYIDTRLDK
jgi:hypothetical protein